VRLQLQKKDGVLVSEKPLPAGNDYSVVVRLAANSNSKPQSFKINFNTDVCDKCKLTEYACTCESHDHDHDHKH